MVYFTWRLVARVFLKVNKRCDMWKEKGSCQHPGLAAPHVSDSARKRRRQKKKRGGKRRAVKMNNVRAMKGEAQDESLHRVGDGPPDQGAS